MPFWKLHKVPLLFTLISIAFYWSFAYDLERTDSPKLISLYVGLWVFFLALLKYAKAHTKLLAVIAFVFRAVFILAIPNLSQDFYRFIWDGRMILEGLNPYLYTPESFFSAAEYPVRQAQELYSGMGALNASHYTNYPPIKQLCFSIAALFSSQSILGSVMVFRVLIIAADFGVFFFGTKLLKALKLPIYNIFWYLLNPFIIIELTGNLHFEGIMIFFLIWSLYLLHLGKWQWAAVIFGVSVSVKLVPLLFLPLLFNYFSSKFSNEEKDWSLKRIDFKTLLSFYAIVGITIVMLFMPFFSSEFFTNYAETVGLWFNTFEFNASMYYLARAIGYQFRGWNEIAIIGKVLPVCILAVVLGFSLFRKHIDTKRLIISMLFAFTAYLFLSTTVHPWYLATLVLLGIFTEYKFALVWSFVIILSYLSYLNLNSADKSENLWITALEYSVVYGVLLWELISKGKRNPTTAAL
ncbi:glycosyltransferase 87 family protein [Sediminibacter sp. Hel_I_10]|uniref:glycosyltransferase 87 family protein n=1 Tax=Sediminibacter sp. Hel_I_10 TaxID=1392490 RepID=UPI00047DC472|nr:glycosyltransferase 87 family protein [Sediminibacter sp. Hel_I_10]